MSAARPGRARPRPGAAAHRALVVAALAAVLVATLPARAATSAPAGRSRPAFPPARPTRVLVLGDSVMKGAAAQYGPALPGRDITVSAEVNRTTGQGADILAGLGSDWDVVVVLLGHNDGGSPGVFQPAANRILDQLANVPRVYWLTLHEVRPYYPAVNAFLRDQAARRRNLRIADWNGLISQHPEGVAGDGLHLTAAGSPLLAGLVAEQVEQTEQDRVTFLRTLTWARAVERARARDALLALAAAKAKAEAEARARATSTTTSTTEPTPTTDPGGVGLIPATSIDRRPTTTTEAEATPTTTDDDASETDGGYGQALALIAGGIGLLGASGLVARRRARRAATPPTTA